MGQPDHHVVSKRGLRASLRAARRALPPAQRAAEAAATVAACRALLAGVPASYAALPDELALDALHEDLWRTRQAVFLPRVVGDRLAWHTVIDAGQLRPGAFGIREPDPALAAAVELPPGCTVLVPGVGFCSDGRRLGQGGGFYDRLLAVRTDLHAIGIGFACQLVDELPCEAHDVRLAGLVIAGRVVSSRSA